VPKTNEKPFHFLIELNFNPLFSRSQCAFARTGRAEDETLQTDKEAHTNQFFHTLPENRLIREQRGNNVSLTSEERTSTWRTP
jgi:hypothetical protein